MNILITYDVETVTTAGKGRLRRVAKVCLNYGQRVQSSVFECCVSMAELTVLRKQLEEIIDKGTDSIRIYHLGKTREKSIESLGKETSYDPEGILMI